MPRGLWRKKLLVSGLPLQIQSLQLRKSFLSLQPEAYIL